MSFLTLAGVPIEVQATGATQPAPTVIGESTRSDNGTLRSTVRGSKRSWKFRTGLLAAFLFLDVMNDFVGDGSFIFVGGDAMDGATVLCELTVGQRDYVQHGATTLGTVEITLSEV